MNLLQLTRFCGILFASGGDSELSYIFPTNENPNRSYEVGEHFSLSVRYNRSKFTESKWHVAPTYKWADNEKVFMPTRRYVEADGSMVDKIERVASLSDSGLYTFWIREFEQVSEEKHFAVNVYMVPTVVLAHSEEDVYQNLNVDKTYVLYCLANCNGRPDFTWEFSKCANFTRKKGCKDNWQLLTGNWSSTKIKQDPTANPFYHGAKLTLTVNQVGSLRCSATNTEGKGSSWAMDIIPSDLPNYKSNPEMYVSPHKCALAQLHDSINLTCQVRIYRDDIEWNWKMRYERNTATVLRQSTVYGSKLSFSRNLTLENIDNESKGIYTCVSNYKGTKVTQSINLDIKDRVQHIQLSRHVNIYVWFDMGEVAQLQFTLKNDQEPSRRYWYHNRVEINITDGRYRRIPNGLEIANTSTSDEGEYVCLFDVLERNGDDCDYDMRTFVLSQRATESFFRKNLTPIIATSAIVCGCLIVALTVILVRMALVNSRSNRALKKLETELQQNEFDPTLPVFAMLENGPVMKPNYPYRLKVDRLIIDRHNLVRLGEGNFGVVLQVGLKMPDGSVERVALKRPKNNFDANQYRMLHMEICLMTYLGKHPNIVNMIGCVTNISHGQLYMVMELCTEGSLENLLKSVRADLSTKFCSELHNPYQNVSDGKRYVQEDFPNWSSVKADMKGFTFHSDLLSYAYQIASAMEYLSSINYIHRDLAARNVLLCYNYKIAKVADFGLGHKIYQENYKIVDKRKSLMMPVRWTAPESLIYREFSSSSDVWSFGILIGEIFSLGELPFAHVAHFDPKKVLSGEIKPNRPKLASDTIYQLMLNCCKPDKKDRVSFSEAKGHLSAELNRCSPEEMAKLLAQLDVLQQQICSSSEPTGNSIFYTNQPGSGSKRSLVVTFHNDTVSSHIAL